MFDKICKVIALIIFSFIAYSLYLHALNERYHFIDNGGVFDRRSGEVFKAKLKE